MDVDVYEDFTPFRVTFQSEPDGSPDSVNVMAYVISVKVTVSDRAAPFTVNEPPCAE